MSIRIGKYSIVQPLGSGGMAEVFKCRLSGIGGFDKVIVVKRMLPHLASDPEFVRMFLDEARLTANLNHPNIVQVYEIDEVDSTPYIAMEYVHGPTLWALTRLLRKNPDKRHFGHLARIMAGICAGLHWAHNATDINGEPLRIVHRDVSPQNILISMSGLPKLCDFGVAKARGRLANTQVGTLKGKYKYIAPEQVRSDSDIDYRADVFSAGVCLFEASTGKLPVTGDSDVELLQAVVGGKYRKPSELLADFPEELERILLSALEPNRDNRCASARHLQEELESFCSSGEWRSSPQEVGLWLRSIFPEDQSALFRPPQQLGTPIWLQPGGQLKPDAPIRHSAESTTLSQNLNDGRANRRPLWAGILAFLLVGIVAVGAAFLFGKSRSSSQVVVNVVPEQQQQQNKGPTADQQLTIYLDELERLAEGGHLGAAQQLVGRAKQLKPTDPALATRLAALEERISRALLVQRGRGYLAAGDAKGASEEAKRALEQSPNDADALALLAEAQKRLEPPEPKPVAQPVERPPSRQASGRITIHSDPPASIFVDRKSMGKAPVRRLVLAEGRHEVVAALQGYLPVERTVVVTRGKDSEISLRLQPEVSKVAVLGPTKPATGGASRPDSDGGGADVPAEGTSAKRNEAAVARAAVPDEKPPAGEPLPKAVARQAEPTRPPESNSVTGPTPSNPGKPRLPATYQARSVSDIVRALGIIENEMVDRGGVPVGLARNVTAPLAEELMGSYAPGVVLELYPRSVYYLVVKRAAEGKSQPAIAEEIRQAQRQGRLRDANQ
jgi:serine/threonine protein kinase